MTDWFQKLTGFAEGDYASTRLLLRVEGDRLRSVVNDKSYGIGTFEVIALGALRDAADAPGRLRVSHVVGDVRRMIADPENAGALFQVASQFNALEMVGPSVSPEDGVTRYQHDHTQGPACAIAAGAATIWRNYFAPVDSRVQTGQTTRCQINTLARLGDRLDEWLGVGEPWIMRNGYAFLKPEAADKIAEAFAKLPDIRDTLLAYMSFALHRDVEATEADRPHTVSQIFCSALPVAYGTLPPERVEPLARLILEAAYEATLLAAAVQEKRVVYLTRLGGGAFGNPDKWIDAAIERALQRCADFDLDVRVVTYG